MDYHIRERYISPDGHYVIIDLLPQMPSKLVNVTTGTASDFGPASAWSVESISWNKDCSRVFCCFLPNLSERTDRGHVFVLLDTATGRTITTHADPDGESALFLLSRHVSWTADQQQLLLHTNRGYCLVRPDRWQITPVGEEIASACKLSASGIRTSPIPGWLLVDNRETSSTFGVSAGGRTCVLLSTNSTTDYVGDGIDTVSPDGKWFAGIKPSGRLIIRPISLQPATQPG